MTVLLDHLRLTGGHLVLVVLSGRETRDVAEYIIVFLNWRIEHAIALAFLRFAVALVFGCGDTAVLVIHGVKATRTILSQILLLLPVGLHSFLLEVRVYELVREADLGVRVSHLAILGNKTECARRVRVSRSLRN